MDDKDKNKDQLLTELQDLRQQLAQTGETTRRQQLALQQVRTEVWRMRSESDLRQVLEAIRASLDAMDIDFSSLGVNVVDRSLSPPLVRYYVYITEGGEPRWDQYDGNQDDGAIIDIQAQKTIVYRPDLSAEDKYRERANLETAYGFSVLSVIDVPFSNGTLALNHSKANAFTERNIEFLQELAATLSESFQRIRDLHTLAERNQALEQEIAERQQVETRLREGEQRLYRMAESLGEGLLVTTEDDQITFANSRMAEMTGYTVEEMIGQKAYKLFLPKSEWPAMSERNAKRFTGESAEYELHLHRRDKSTFWAHITATPYRDDQGAIVGTVGAHIDITERKEIELQLSRQTEELRQSQKMEAIGQLTAGIAHNFNNLLVGIIGNVELATQEAPAHLHSLLAGANRSAHQAAAMVAQLMDYSRQNIKMPYEPLAPKALAEEVVSICRRTFDRKIDLSLHTPNQLPAILGDPTQLNQVFLNLLINARDALEDANRSTPFIRIEIDEVTRKTDEMPQNTEASPGAFVRVRVTDNGAGIDEQTLQRVFDPFFTTKPVDKGTGLGLSTVYGIVLQHGGWVECNSQIDEETVFSIYLPVSKQSLPKADRPTSGALPRGTETILVIEDEEEVQMVLNRTLERCGYKTLIADNGPDGLALYDEHRSEIAIVLLDLSMPKMSGEEVLDRLRAIDPQIKILIISGYAVTSKNLIDKAEVLHKPLSIKVLANKIREILDA